MESGDVMSLLKVFKQCCAKAPSLDDTMANMGEGMVVCDWLLKDITEPHTFITKSQVKTLVVPTPHGVLAIRKLPTREVLDWCGPTTIERYLDIHGVTKDMLEGTFDWNTELCSW